MRIFLLARLSSRLGDHCRYTAQKDIRAPQHETYSKPFAFPTEEPFSCDHRSSDRPCVFSHPVLYGLSTVASRKGLNLAPQRKLFGYRDENQGTPWLIWLDSLTEDRIFLRATSVRVNNGSSAPLQKIFNELKNFKHLENVMVVWQYNASVPRIEETIAETIVEVEQQGKDALPHVEILVFAWDP